jgi:CRISPR/Cas system-associated protein Cas10 (large subunit of type III CRISPR-Cas system)
VTAPERLIRDVARRYDQGGLLADGALRLLERLTAESGKTCAGCRERRPLSAFGRDSREAVGLSRLCRRCIAARDAGARVNGHSS